MNWYYPLLLGTNNYLKKFEKDLNQHKNNIEHEKTRLISFLKNAPHYKDKNLNDFSNMPFMPAALFKDKKYCQNENSPFNGEKIKYIAQSSGTTGEHKYFPYTKNYTRKLSFLPRAMVASILKSIGYQKVQYIFNFTTAAPPKERVISHHGQGFLTHLQYHEVPKLYQKFYGPPFHITHDERLFQNLFPLYALSHNINMLFMVTPHRLKHLLADLSSNFDEKLKLLDNLNITSKKRLQYLNSIKDPTLHNLWPNLHTIVCWKKSICAPVVNELQKTFHGNIMETMYACTEAQLAIPLHHLGLNGSVLNCKNQYLEFIEEEEKEIVENLRDFRELKEGKLYKVYITNYLGLVRYPLGDIIQVVGFHKGVPLVEFVRKDKATILLGHTRISQEIFLECTSRLNLKNRFLFTASKDQSHLIFWYHPEENIDLSVERYLDDELIKRVLNYKDDRQSKLIKPLKIKMMTHSQLDKIKVTHNQGKEMITRQHSL